jgi:hypothetical protein
MIFRKLSDIKREQELAAKSYHESTDVSSTGNNAIRKLLTKFRKKSVDSRNDSDSHDNVSSPLLLLGNNGSSSDLTKQRRGSNANIRLNTINEKSESYRANRGGEILAKLFSDANDTDSIEINYPILPPLSEATSVKQKWIILLSKAKGGVENIPKVFLMSEQQNELMNDDYNSRKNPIIIESTPVDDEQRIYSDHSDVNKMRENLDESQGFFLEPFDQHGTSRRSSRSLEFLTTIDDTTLCKNPHQFLNVLIDCRNDLKTNIDMLNNKISNVDTRIAKLFSLMNVNINNSNSSNDAIESAGISKTNQSKNSFGNFLQVKDARHPDSNYSLNVNSTSMDMGGNGSKRNLNFNILSPPTSISVEGGLSNISSQNNKKNGSLFNTPLISDDVSQQPAVSQSSILTTLTEVSFSKTPTDENIDIKKRKDRNSSNASIAAATAAAAATSSSSISTTAALATKTTLQQPHKHRHPHSQHHHQHQNLSGQYSSTTSTQRSGNNNNNPNMVSTIVSSSYTPVNYNINLLSTDPELRFLTSENDTNNNNNHKSSKKSSKKNFY